MCQRRRLSAGAFLLGEGRAMPAKKQVAPELIAEGRYLYEETLTPIHEIGKRMGLSRSAFYLRVRAWNWQPRRYGSGVTPGEESRTPAMAAPSRPPGPAGGDHALVSSANEAGEPCVVLYRRVYRAALSQMDTVEQVQRTLLPNEPAQSERTVRVTATLNKVLLELATLAKPQEDAPPDAEDDDPVPRDIDEFRRELARRIRGFIEARRNGAA
jgi:hypothetical protein